MKSLFDKNQTTQWPLLNVNEEIELKFAEFEKKLKEKCDLMMKNKAQLEQAGTWKDVSESNKRRFIAVENIAKSFYSASQGYKPPEPPKSPKPT